MTVSDDFTYCRGKHITNLEIQRTYLHKIVFKNIIDSKPNNELFSYKLLTISHGKAKVNK